MPEKLMPESAVPEKSVAEMARLEATSQTCDDSAPEPGVAKFRFDPDSLDDDTGFDFSAAAGLLDEEPKGSADSTSIDNHQG
jgi:hypothetical protein